jgi:PAS domain S-box-containing protein
VGLTNQLQPAEQGPSIQPQHVQTHETLSERASRQKADELSALLASIVENSDDAIISSNLDGIITSWNTGAERIFGYTASETVGQTTSMLGSHSAEEDPAIIVKKIRCGERVEHYETIRRHKDGSDIIVSLTVSPIRNSEGDIIGASKIARDITSTRQAEQALRNADKLALAGRMTASIAHEINNPLEAITNLLYLLQQESISEKGRDYLELAERELMRVSHIASQTLGFFRGSRGPAYSQLADIVDSAISLHAGRLTVSDIAVKTEYLPVAPLHCQQGELRQVLANLVSNALDSITSKGRLVVRVRPATDMLGGLPGVRLTVADTGIGMTKRTLAQLFEPFYTTKGSTGTGLGLWVTRQIISRHHGRIAVRSSQDPAHHGTVFSIFFPYLEPANSSKSFATIPASRTEPTSIESASSTSPADESRHTPAEPDRQSTAYNAA